MDETETVILATVIVLGGLGVLFLISYIITSNKYDYNRESEKLNNAFKELEKSNNFNLKQVGLTDIFAVNEEKENLIIFNGQRIKSIAFQDILMVEILYGGNIIRAKSTKRTIDGFKAKNTDTLNAISGFKNIYIRITLKETQNPFSFPCYIPETHDDYYSQGELNATRIYSIISGIIDNIDRVIKRSDKKKKALYKDELTKFFELKERGIITEEEFSLIKKRIISEFN